MGRLLLLILIVNLQAGCANLPTAAIDINPKGGAGFVRHCDGGWFNTMGAAENYNHCENFLD